MAASEAGGPPFIVGGLSMAPLPKILAGGPTRETSSLVFQAHREGLEAQAVGVCGNCGHPSTFPQHDYAGKCRIDQFPGPLASGQPKCDCSGLEVTQGFELEIRHVVTEDSGGPRWHHDKIERVANVRQQFLNWSASSLRHGVVYDGLFMVDSDVILGPGVLARMWAVDAPVVFGVYRTYADWGGSMGYWDQCWNRHPYGWTPECKAGLDAPGVNEVEVLGGGACTLIRGRGFESRYWPLLQSLRNAGGMFPGEDRSYCLGLEARGIKMVGVTNLPIHHCYAIGDHTKPALERIRKKVGLFDEVAR